MIRIALLGDFAPLDGTESVRFDVDIKGSDLVLMNLEVPLCNNLKPRPKAGPSLFGHYDVLSRFATKNFVITLANNHIMDYGEVGLQETINACRNAGFKTIGAGANLDVALEPVICTLNGVEIGILACSETQFGIATPWRAGAAPIIPGKIESRIRQLAQQVDIVVVTVHGAAEMCPWPSPQWQDLLRGFIDAGALIVHGHHSHVPQGYEKYNNGLIFYGLGNFLVTPREWKDTPNALWSIIGDVALSREGIEKLIIRTAVLENNKYDVVRESDDGEAALHHEYLSCANRPLDDRKLLTGLWQESSIRMYYLWNAKWLGFEPGRRKKHISASQEDLLLRHHLFACESHRDSIATALGVLSCELDDLRTDETRALADEMMPWSVDGNRD